MQLQKQVKTGLLWSGAQVWGKRGINLLILAVLSRLLTPDSFGLVALASVFIALIEVFLDQGFGDAIIQRVHLDEQHLDTAFWSNMVLGSLLALLGWAASGLVASLFQEPGLTDVIKWLSLGFALFGLSATQQAILRRRLAFRELAVRSLMASVAGGLAAIVLAVLGLGVWSLVAQVLVSGAAGVLVLWKVSDWRPHVRFSLSHFRDLLSFGLHITGTNFLNFINRHADDALIGIFLGPTALGYYTIAYKLLLVMTEMLTGVTTAVAFPAFARVQHRPDVIRQAFYRACRITSAVAFPSFLGLAAVAPILFPVVFGPQWSPSIPVTQLLALIGVLHSVFYYNDAIMLAVGKPAWRLGITLMNAVGNVIAFSIAVRWGIVAVAGAYVLRGYLLSPIPLLALRKLVGIDIREYLAQLWETLCASVLMMAVVLLVARVVSPHVNGYGSIPATFIAGILAYLLALRALAPGMLQQIYGLLRRAVPDWRTHEA